MISLESDKITALNQMSAQLSLLWDILKLHTKLNKFCKRSLLMISLEIEKWLLYDQITA